MSNEVSKQESKTAPDDLIKTNPKVNTELSEQELGKVSGGEGPLKIPIKDVIISGGQS